MPRAVPAVSRALDVLELFLDAPSQDGGPESGTGMLSAPEIGKRLRLPRTSVHEIVGTLLDRGYLAAAYDQPTRYRLGIRLFQLGGRFAEGLDLTREAQTVAAQIAGECDETVHVAVLDGTDVVYIAKVDSTHSVRMVSALGRRLPAHCTAVGKMLLACLRPDDLVARLPTGGALPAMTRQSITSAADLRAQLAEITADGLAFDDCESNEAVHCVAAPVRDHTGSVVAAMSISVPSPRWNAERRRAWSDLVRRGAATLSSRLGHRPAA